MKFRFRIGTDSTDWDLGWYIDDVRIYTCGVAVPTNTPSPTRTRTATPPGWTQQARQNNYLSMLRRDKTPTPTPTPTTIPTPPSIFYSIGDSTVIQGYAGTNYGDADDMLVGFDKNYYDPALKAVRSLVQFDLSAIPAGTNISSATLNLYFVEWLDVPNTSRTITTYRISSGWSEMSVNWNNKPSFGESYGAASIKASSNWRYVAFDVTELVRAWVNNTHPNYGIMLRGPESSIWLRGFYTRESSYDPYLSIAYGSSSAWSEPPIPAYDPAGINGSSILDHLPDTMDWESCLDQSSPTICLDHK